MPDPFHLQSDQFVLGTGDNVVTTSMKTKLSIRSASFPKHHIFITLDLHYIAKMKARLQE